MANFMGPRFYLLVVTIVLTVIIIILGTTQIEAFRRRRRGYWRGWRHPRRSYRWGYPWYYFGGTCKNGCTYIGNDRWGCQYPGSGSNDCWFASDCYWCGSGNGSWY